MNLPNKLSLTRMALIPVMVALMYVDNTLCHLLSAAVFAIAAFTDFLDGHIARKEGIVTDFGKFVDPVADKLLVLSALIMLVQQGLMPAWVVILILARELCVDGLRMVAGSKGMVIAAGKLGKIKTVSQMVLILFLMLAGRLTLIFLGGTAWAVAMDVLRWVMIIWAVVITVWSGVDYFARNFDVIRNAK